MNNLLEPFPLFFKVWGLGFRRQQHRQQQGPSNLSRLQSDLATLGVCSCFGSKWRAGQIEISVVRTWPSYGCRVHGKDEVGMKGFSTSERGLGHFLREVWRRSVVPILCFVNGYSVRHHPFVVKNPVPL